MLIPSAAPVSLIEPTRYPDKLRKDAKAPQRLFARGACAFDDAPSVAIVGTRAADVEALDFAFELARRACQAGYRVVSGGALGIDTAAHRGALDAGGETIAVLAASVREAYPASNRQLFADITEAGLLLSPHDDGTAYRGRFLARNRVIAALSNITIVVQAPARSGALSTAAAAKKLGRELWVVPASPWDRRGAGNRRLMRAGARPLVQIDQLFGHRRSTPPNAAEAKARSLAERLSKVLSCLGSRPRHGDEIAAQLGLSAADVQARLIELAIEGWVEERAGARWVRSR